MEERNSKDFLFASAESRLHMYVFVKNTLMVARMRALAKLM